VRSCYRKFSVPRLRWRDLVWEASGIATQVAVSAVRWPPRGDSPGRADSYTHTACQCQHTRLIHYGGLPEFPRRAGGGNEEEKPHDRRKTGRRLEKVTQGMQDLATRYVKSGLEAADFLTSCRFRREWKVDHCQTNEDYTSKWVHQGRIGIVPPNNIQERHRLFQSLDISNAAISD